MSERIDVANIPPRPKSLVGGYGILIRPHRLPLDELPWEDFERLCVRLLKKDPNNEIARTFGIRGEAQGAIDLYARKRSTGRYEVWQCKCYKKFDKSDVKKAVDKFINTCQTQNAGIPIEKVDALILAVSSDLSRATVAKEIERYNELMMSRYKITLIPQDIQGLSDKLKPHADIVADFFHPFYVERFSGIKAENKNGRPPPGIPERPSPYIAHPYLLLQTTDLIGRRLELHLLNNWILARENKLANIRVLSIVAMGGMGKSALTWNWFNKIAPQQQPLLAGRVWWSFYESGADFKNFIIGCLAYVSGLSEKEILEMSDKERMDELLIHLNAKPFLIVLDGLERILMAYPRLDAARMPEEDLDEKTANSMVGMDYLSQSFAEKHVLRQCVDQEASEFLQRLLQVGASRVLISTRLYPVELQMETGLPRHGAYWLELSGLPDAEALALWDAFTGDGPVREAGRLLKFFKAFGHYPLLIQVLAGIIAEYRPAPGDFAKWLNENPDFNPARLPLKKAKTHILHFALLALPKTEEAILNCIAAFRMPANWETLRGVLSNSLGTDKNDRLLMKGLSKLQDRGLIGWDKASNRYDLHPLVRGVVWGRLEKSQRQAIYRDFVKFLSSVPKINHDAVRSVEDLAVPLELYYALISLERYDEAWGIFKDELNIPLGFRISANRQRLETLEALQTKAAQHLNSSNAAMKDLEYHDNLAHSKNLLGEPGESIKIYESVGISTKKGAEVSSVTVSSAALCRYASALRVCGRLYEDELVGKEALLLARKEGAMEQEAHALRYLACSEEIRGHPPLAFQYFERSRKIFETAGNAQAQGRICTHMAQLIKTPAKCLHYVKLGRELGQSTWQQKRDFIFSDRMLGRAHLELGNLPTAETLLELSLSRARSANVIEEEVAALTLLARLNRQRKNYAAARELLIQVKAPVERGPFVLLHADAWLLLAHLEADIGNAPEAISAGLQAYKLAWCDGPPYVYTSVLENAQRLLRSFHVEEPPLRHFDSAVCNPMANCNCNPQDQYHANTPSFEVLWWECSSNV